MDWLTPARSCLEHFETYWAERGWDLPDRRYIAPGSAAAIADDSAQFVVGLVQAAPGAGLRSPLPSKGTGAQGTPAVTYAARLIRCSESVTDMSVPNAERIDEEGERSLRDAARMWRTMLDWRMSEPLSKGNNAPFDGLSLQPVGPEGAVYGHQATFVLSAFLTEEA